jgi:ketosteroid isomerase-like protein
MPEPDSRRDPPAAPLASEWVDKLEIREVIERSMRYIDDQAGRRLAALFDEDAVLQLAGTVFAGREAIGNMFRSSADPPRWTEPGELLKQPAGVHRGSNPVIDVDGDTATAETDMLVLERDQEGRARITLVARYRDRFRRSDDGRWVITNRTGVSVARPGEAGNDAEWARALARMSDDTRAKFRTD